MDTTTSDTAARYAILYGDIHHIGAAMDENKVTAMAPALEV